MKKKILIPVCIVLACILLAVGAMMYMNANTLAFSVGRCLVANGRYMMVVDNSPIVMADLTEGDGMFAGLTDGDKILVLHTGIEQSYPGKTGVYAVWKLSDGTVEDIPTNVTEGLTELGWLTGEYGFTFALTWNCYGISSYDSNTGKLVKTTDTTNPADYITELHLTDEQTEQIYKLITELDVNAYPDEYNPNGNAASSPPMTLILSVKIGGIEKTIRAKNIAISYAADNEKGQAFLTTCKTIIDMIESTEEWKALPEYEVYYE